MTETELTNDKEQSSMFLLHDKALEEFMKEVTILYNTLGERG